MMNGLHFELPDNICEQIYRKVDLEYTKEDAFVRLVNNFSLCEDDEAIKEFEAKYKCTLDLALEEMAQMFYDYQDCEIPDNQTWKHVIEMWLEEATNN